MTEIRADITERMSDYVEQLVDQGLYKSKAEYIREKIRNDIKHGITPGGEK